MDISLSLSPQEMLSVNREVDAFNKSLTDGKTTKLPNAAMDKNDFLKILITQLSHQDPTQPMQDKEFIAQMAQFSSLEQITNMSEGLSKVAGLLASTKALDLLGQTVVLGEGADAVTAGEYPQLLVNGKYYDFSQVQTIKRDVNESTRGARRTQSAQGAMGKE